MDGDQEPAQGMTSSAAVLHAAFSKLSDPGLPQGPLHERWRAAMGLPSEVPIYWSLEQTARLVTTVGAQAELLPDRFNRSKSQAREVVANLKAVLEPPMLGQPWSSAAQYVTNDCLNLLGMVADLLDAQFPEGCPGEGVIPDLIARIDAVTEALDGVPYPAHARAAIEGRVAALRWAVENWHLVGAGGVTDLMGAMGSAVSVATAGALPQGGPAADRVHQALVSALDWIGRCMVVREAGSGLVALAPYVQQLLLTGPQ